MSAVVIYEHAGKLWVRNAVEFDDGRFEKLDKPFVALDIDGPAGEAGDLIERLPAKAPDNSSDDDVLRAWKAGWNSMHDEAASALAACQAKVGELETALAEADDTPAWDALKLCKARNAELEACVGELSNDLSGCRIDRICEKSRAEAAEAKVAALTADLAEARQKLFPYADATEISGMSWGEGWYLIGDRKSIDKFRSVMHQSDQLEVYRKAFDEYMAKAKSDLEALDRTAAALRTALETIDAEIKSGARTPWDFAVTTRELIAAALAKAPQS